MSDEEVLLFTSGYVKHILASIGNDFCVKLKNQLENIFLWASQSHE